MKTVKDTVDCSGVEHSRISMSESRLVVSNSLPSHGSPQGFSVHQILQAKILECVAVPVHSKTVNISLYLCVKANCFLPSQHHGFQEECIHQIGRCISNATAGTAAETGTTT